MNHSDDHSQTLVLDEAVRWQAFEDRDRHFDGLFVVAVHSTGIYCRPSCPARRPMRKNVEFFDTNADAERAGFRPCRRCRPDEVDSQAEMVREVCALIDAATDAIPTLEELGEQVAVSPAHLQRVFKRLMGVSPRQYADARRVERFKTQLKSGDSVTRAIYGAGYNSSSRAHPGVLGMTPTDYQRGGQGMTITYTITPSTLGYLLVAATDRGVCSVMLDDSPEVLEAELAKEYPRAELYRDGESMHEWVDALVQYLDGDPAPLDLPVDVQATAFQRRVWDALREIPYGATRTYAEVAEIIGAPKAVRAVGHACATNKVALIIPCHRVLRTDGSLGGFRWGLDRKRALIDQEKATVPETADDFSI
jgi:AraC family transcriptional regulator of adaptative response/methylated-DNA-[protein]-cysteine methyltransferase